MIPAEIHIKNAKKMKKSNIYLSKLDRRTKSIFDKDKKDLNKSEML